MNIRGAMLHRDDGYSLVEFTVAVLIVGVMLTFAIPTLLSARFRAQDRAAQSILRDTVTSAKVIFTDGKSYTTVTPGPDGNLAASQPQLQFVDAVTVSSSSVVISVEGSQTRFRAAAKSATGRCWYVRESVTAPSGLAWAVADRPGNTCRAKNAPPDAHSAWADQPGEAVEFGSPPDGKGPPGGNGPPGGKGPPGVPGSG